MLSFRWQRVGPCLCGSSFTGTPSRGINHHGRIGDERSNFGLPVLNLLAVGTGYVMMVADGRCFLDDKIIFKKRDLSLTVWVCADRMFDPEGIDHIGFNTGFYLRPVKGKQCLSKWFVFVPIHRLFCQAFEGGLERFKIHWLDLGFDDKPGHWIKVYTHHLASQSKGFNDGCSSSH